MAELQLDGVCRVYPSGVRAVDDASLSVSDCELLALVGPSGCGKTTLLRLVAGLEAMTAGSVRIGGSDVTALPPRDRDVAMVLQGGALYPHMTVYKNMAFGLLLRTRKGSVARAIQRLSDRGATRAARHSGRAIRERVDSAATVLGIRHLLGRYPRQLSGGERQRAALGRAMVRDPQVFLFDEPLSSLDASLRFAMRAELRRLQRRLRATMLYITHDQEDAMTLGDRVAVMRDGRIQQCDSPDAVYDRPANRFVAGFFGTPPMNFVPGRLAGEVYFESGAVRLALPPATAAALPELPRREVVLGLRPTCVSDRREGAFAGPDNTFDATIEAVERAGENADVHVQTACGVRLVCRLDGNREETFRGERSLVLRADMTRAHLFEPGEPGRNLIPDEHGTSSSG